MKSCANCKNTVNGNYCENCGQRASVDRVTFRDTAGDLFDTFLAPKGPLIYTIRALIVRPGYLFREYLSGSRKKFYKPVSFFVLATVVYLLVRWLLDFNPIKSTPDQGGMDVDTMKTIQRASQFMFANISKFLFLLIFTLALFLKIFFYRRHSLAEYVAVSFYLVGVYTLVTTISMFILTFVLPDLQLLPMIVMLLYFMFAMVKWLGGNTLLMCFKALITWILATLFYIGMAFGLSYLIVLFEIN